MVSIKDLNCKKQVLVVDDDKDIRDLLATYLTKNNFDVIKADGGVEMDLRLETNQPDLIILDIMMSGDDGFILCQRIRRTSNVPIIMLTANSDEMDRILGLEIGADDYIAKPFSPRELLARIKALLRRTGFMNTEPVEVEIEVEKARFYQFLNWTFDANKQQLADPDKKNVSLTGGDALLLSLFLESCNEPISRDQICQSLHGRNAFSNERSIDVHLSRLRQCLGDDAKCPTMIKTVRGKGYLFIADVKFSNSSL